MKTSMRMFRNTDGDLCFDGIISANELIRVNFDAIDHAVINSIGVDGTTAADWLLGLEILFRRMHEQLK